MPGTVFLPAGETLAATRVLTLTLYDTDGTFIQSIDLTNYSVNGLAVQHIEIGSPTPRPVVYPLPNQDGQADYTQWMGPRSVTISGIAYSALAGSRSAAYSLLAPYLNPKARPVLTYALDGDQPIRSLILTPYSWLAPADTSTGPGVLAFAAQWTASDPVALGTTVHTANVSLSTGTEGGRTYNLTFPRVYPTGGSAPGLAALNVGGNYQTWPLYYIYGPCTNPIVQIWDFDDDTILSQVAMSNFSLQTGQWLYVDTKNRYVWLNGSSTSSQSTYLNFATTSWSQLSPGMNFIHFVATAGGPPSNLVVTWQSAWIT